jgi:hypothetical protein
VRLDLRSSQVLGSADFWNPTGSPVGPLHRVSPRLTGSTFDELVRVTLGQRRIDHLERHDPGQLADMTEREPATRHPPDTGDDRIRTQRSSWCGEGVLEDDLSYRSSAP